MAAAESNPQLNQSKRHKNLPKCSRLSQVAIEFQSSALHQMRTCTNLSRIHHRSVKLNKCQPVQRRLTIAIDKVSKSQSPTTLRLSSPKPLINQPPLSASISAAGSTWEHHMGGSAPMMRTVMSQGMRLVVNPVITIEI